MLLQLFCGLIILGSAAVVVPIDSGMTATTVQPPVFRMPRNLQIEYLFAHISNPFTTFLDCLAFSSQHESMRKLGFAAAAALLITLCFLIIFLWK
jgi:hypothetical protein